MTIRKSTRVSARLASSQAEPKLSPAVTRKRRISEEIPVKSVKKQKQKQVKTKPKSKDEVEVVKEEEPQFQKPEGPVTPLRKARTSKLKAPPLTPTPSLVGLMRAPYSSGDIDDATPPPADRPVEPHTSSATLVTPGGTQTVAYRNGETDETPSNHHPTPTGTTGTLLEQACAHLIKVDPNIRPLVEKHRCAVFSPEGLAEQIDPFRSLSSGIMGQQVSGAAAKSIKNKFIALFNEGSTEVPTFPTTKQVVATSIERLRLAGLSQRKAEYIQGLAEKFESGELTNEMLMNATDEEVMEKLIAVRGLGKWSVEMFACFGLKRMDILSTGDLGVQRGMAHYFGRDVAKLKAKGGGKWKYMSEQDMIEKSAVYAPYRSLFMWYMWRVEDVDVEVMQSTL